MAVLDAAYFSVGDDFLAVHPDGVLKCLCPMTQ